MTKSFYTKCIQIIVLFVFTGGMVLIALDMNSSQQSISFVLILGFMSGICVQTFFRPVEKIAKLINNKNH